MPNLIKLKIKFSSKYFILIHIFLSTQSLIKELPQVYKGNSPKNKKNTVFMGMIVGLSGSSGGSNSNNALVSYSHSKILANLSRNF